jgi:chaperonin GroEL
LFLSSRITFRTIVENAGLEGSVVVAKASEGQGILVTMLNYEYVDMLSGIIRSKESNSCSIEKQLRLLE